MKRLVKIYYYLFYKFYKFSETAPSRWWSDWKAGIVILAIELCIFFSIAIYLMVYADINILSSKSKIDPITVSFLATILLFNWYFLFYKDRWKDEIRQFESWPKSKQRKGTLLVILFVLLVISNLIFAFYQLSKVVRH